jgi:hypothetical protein
MRPAYRGTPIEREARIPTDARKICEMNGRVSLLVAVAIFLVSPVHAQPRKLALAIARLDGRLVPFAAYEAGRWERAWPEADEATDETLKIDETPSIWRRSGARVPRLWHVWPLSGKNQIDVHVKGVEIVEAHCTRQLALTTDLPEAEGEHPLKFGVGTESDVRLNVIEEVSRSGVQWRDAEQAVLASFSRLESSQAQTEHLKLTEEMPGPAVTLTALYRERDLPSSAMYFVAEKKYRTPVSAQDPDCSALTIVTGWLMPTSSGFSIRSAKVFITNCDAIDARTALPLAALRLSGDLFWVLQEHGYEDETYIVADVRPGGVRYVLVANGGGC